MGRTNPGRRRGRPRGNRSHGFTQATVEQLRQQLDEARARDGLPTTKELKKQVKRPIVIENLTSADAAAREEACNDVVVYSLTRENLEALLLHEAHVILKTQRLEDEAYAVRCAASTALRNMVNCGGDVVVDMVVDAPTVGRVITVFQQSFEYLVQLHLGNKPSFGGVDIVASDALRGVEESLKLLTSLTEASEPAASMIAETPQLLSQLVELLASAASTPSAAELLHMLSDDNSAVAAFLENGISPEQRAFLNGAISEIPSDPRKLQSSTRLCGVLLNCAPTETNLKRIVPMFAAAIAVNPVEMLQQILPDVQDGASEVESTDKATRVEACVTQYNVLQAGMECVADLLSVICEMQDEEEDDEVAFRRNPAAGLLTQTDLLGSLVRKAGQLLAPMTDQQVLSFLGDGNLVNAQGCRVRQLYSSIEVSSLSAISTTMLLVPVKDVGNSSMMWRAVLGGIKLRAEMASSGVAQGADANKTAVATTSFSRRHHLIYQLESLAQIAFTIVRKDSTSIVPSCDDVQLLVALCRSDLVTKDIAVAVLGLFGTSGPHLQDPHAAARMADMTSFMLRHEDPEVAGEALNATIDLFSDERFDEGVFVPQNLMQVLSEFKEYYSKVLASMPKRHPAKKHLKEIFSNIGPFLEYKKANIPRSSRR